MKKSLLEKTTRRVKELLGGSKTYSKRRYGPAKNEYVDKVYGAGRKRKNIKKVEKKKFKTTRTAVIEKRLRNAGLTEKEISRFRGK